MQHFSFETASTLVSGNPLIERSVRQKPQPHGLHDIDTSGSATWPLVSLDATHPDVLSKYAELPKHSCGRQANR